MNIGPSRGDKSTYSLPKPMSLRAFDKSTNIAYGFGNESVWAYNLNDEKELWSQSEGTPGPSSLHSVDDLLINVGGVDSVRQSSGLFAKCLDKDTGQILWEKEIETSDIDHRAIVTSDKYLVINFRGGRIVGVDLSNGSISWEIDDFQMDAPSPLITSNNGDVLLRVGTMRLVFLNSKTGAVHWDLEAEYASPTGEGYFLADSILQNTVMGHTLKIDYSSGEIVRRRTADGRVFQGAKMEGSEFSNTGIRCQTGPEVDQSSIYYGISGNRLIAIPKSDLDI
jgi:outer membrane protein assembly factor BamB